MHLDPVIVYNKLALLFWKGDLKMPLESRFQSKLIKELKALFPGAIILKNDPNYLQGFPDLTIFHGSKWAVLDPKATKNSPRQPNQQYYVDITNDMSFGSFIYPENKEEVLSGLQRTFRHNW